MLAVGRLLLAVGRLLLAVGSDSMVPVLAMLNYRDSVLHRQLDSSSTSTAVQYSGS